MGQCSLVDCSAPARTRGWCKRHYDKWVRTGDPEFAPKTDLLTQILARTTKVDGCLVWNGPSTDPQGRGSVRFQGRAHRAHQVVWTLSRGLVPDGVVIRHTCDVAACLDLDHMVLGTQADNMQDKVDRGRSRWKVCRNGLHEMTGDNIYTMPSKPDYHECRACRAERYRRHLAKREEAA